jgi:hypothetical protein
MTTDDPAGPAGHRGRDDGDTHPGADAAAAVAGHAGRVKRRELAEALGKLDGDEFTDEQRGAVEALADRLVEAVVGGPTERLRTADRPVADEGLALFDPALAPAADRAVGESGRVRSEATAREVADGD